MFLVMSRDGRQIFLQGHPEYDRMTLNNEYHRDLSKGLDPKLPYNYYENNDPFSVPPLDVAEHGKHAVYQLAELTMCTR